MQHAPRKVGLKLQSCLVCKL